MVAPMHKDMITKQKYCRTLVVLTSIIILLAVSLIVSINIKPKTEIVEVERIVTEEIVTEKEIIIEIEKEPLYAYNITSEEREMLARLVYREANTEDIECQKAIVSVVINRWQSGKWGSTLEDVIYAKSQFSPANILYRTTPNETNYNAVDEVIKNGTTLPYYILYFRANYHFNWYGYNAYTKMGDTCFGYLTKDI